jgi:hypothetical protein
MADHIWSVLCEKHLVNPDNRLITIVEVVEGFSETGLDERLEEARQLGKRGVLIDGHMQLISWWYRTDPTEEETLVRFDLRNPAGDKVYESTTTITWPSAKGSVPARIFLALERFPVTMFGLHWFIVEYKRPTKNKVGRWVTATKIPLIVDMPSGTTAPAPPSEPTPSAPPASS